VQLMRASGDQKSVSRTRTDEAGRECQPMEGTAMSHRTEWAIGTEQAVATRGPSAPLRNRPNCGDHPRPSAMLTVHELAALLHCSTRTIYRLTANGRIPEPCRLGSLLRWPRAQIEAWIAEGCPGAARDEVLV